MFYIIITQLLNSFLSVFLLSIFLLINHWIFAKRLMISLTVIIFISIKLLLAHYSIEYKRYCTSKTINCFTGHRYHFFFSPIFFFNNYSFDILFFFIKLSIRTKSTPGRTRHRRRVRLFLNTIIFVKILIYDDKNDIILSNKSL